MSCHLRTLLQLATLACEDPCDSFRGEIHIDEARGDIGDLTILGDTTVTDFHDRDAFEHCTSPPGFRQPRSKAEEVARVKRLTVEYGIHHVPAKVVGVLVEPYVDQFRDPLPASECAVKHVVIDPVLAEQLSETLPVMLLNRAAKFLQQVLYVHLGFLHPVEVASPLHLPHVGIDRAMGDVYELRI